MRLYGERQKRVTPTCCKALDYLFSVTNGEREKNVSFTGINGNGWLVGCFGFNDPLRQYFSLYRAVSQREGETKDKR